MNTQCKKYGIVQRKNETAAHFIGPNQDDIAPRKDYWLQNIFSPMFFEPGAVTYVNNDYDYSLKNVTLSDTPVDNPPQGTLSQYYCGSLRCASLGVFVFGNQTDDSMRGDFYECNVTVSDVKNAMVPAHRIVDHVARLAAGSIGLNGLTMSGDGYKQQFVKYSDETFWGNSSLNKDAQDVAGLIGTFGIGSLVTMDRVGPGDTAPGIVVYPGKRMILKLRGEYLYAIVGATIGAHLLMIPLLIYFANPVPIKAVSPLSPAKLAKLLSHLVQQLETDSAASGDRVAEALNVDESKYKLELTGNVPGWSELKEFPKGSYQ